MPLISAAFARGYVEPILGLINFAYLVWSILDPLAVIKQQTCLPCVLDPIRLVVEGWGVISLPLLWSIRSTMKILNLFVWILLQTSKHKFRMVFCILVISQIIVFYRFAIFGTKSAFIAIHVVQSGWPHRLIVLDLLLLRRHTSPLAFFGPNSTLGTFTVYGHTHFMADMANTVAYPFDDSLETKTRQITPNDNTTMGAILAPTMHS